MTAETKRIPYQALDRNGNQLLSPEGRFVPGNRMGGRPKGARALLAEAFLRDVKQVWDEKGLNSVHRCADETPARFAMMVSSILPKEVSGPDGGPIDVGGGAVEALLRKLGSLEEKEMEYAAKAEGK